MFQKVHSEEQLCTHWLSKSNAGSCYHGENNQVYLGIVVPWIILTSHKSFDDSTVTYKDIKKLLENGTRVAYARALTKGGYHQDQKAFPGGI